MASERAEGAITVGQAQDPYRGLGIAIEYLMAAPAFARQPFGVWSRILVGQINRKHYAIARRGGHTVGFAGYGRCAPGIAERWLTQQVEPTSKECSAGPVLLLNAWMSDNDAVARKMRAWLHAANSDATMLVGKRFYADGRVRPVRLNLRKVHAEARGRIL